MAYLLGFLHLLRYLYGSEHGPGCDPRVALPAADPPDNLN
jgi:hypothetical protein